MPEPEELLPMPPTKGPPLPRGLSQYWPQSLQVILHPPFPLRLHYQREEIRKLDEIIDFLLRKPELTEGEIAHIEELVSRRAAVVRRAAEIKRFRE